MTVTELLELFCQSMLARNLSPRTVDWYRVGCQRFFDWLAANNLHNGDWLQPATIEAYLAASRTAGNRPATVAGHYRSLRGFFAWLVERRYLPADANPMTHVKPPRIPPHEPRRATVEEYAALIDSIPQATWINLRDRLIIQTLFLCGVRLGECTRLTASDYRTEQHLLRVNGKTGVRLIPTPPAVERAFVAYMLNRPPSPVPALFLGADNTGNPRTAALQEKSIYRMIRRRCTDANLRPLNPHAFRHGIAMYLLNEGGDMSLVQRVLGHKQITTTSRHYADWLTEGLIREYQEKMRGLGQ